MFFFHELPWLWSDTFLFSMSYPTAQSNFGKIACLWSKHGFRLVVEFKWEWCVPKSKCNKKSTLLCCCFFPISTRQKERKKKPFENPNPWSILVAGMPSPGWHYLFWVRESQIKPSFGRSHAVTIWALSVWWNGGDDRSSNMFSMLRMFPLFRP